VLLSLAFVLLSLAFVLLSLVLPLSRALLPGLTAGLRPGLTWAACAGLASAAPSCPSTMNSVNDPLEYSKSDGSALCPWSRSAGSSNSPQMPQNCDPALLA